MNLYHIQQEHLALLAEIEEAEGELAPHVEQALGFTTEAFQEKAVSVGFVTKHIGNGIAAIDAEIKRLQAMKAAATKRQEWFEEMLTGAMHQFGVTKIDTPILKISFRASAAVEIDDESKLPTAALTEVPASWKPDKAKIKKMIQEGIEVPGASLVTRQNIQIK